MPAVGMTALVATKKNREMLHHAESRLRLVEEDREKVISDCDLYNPFSILTSMLKLSHKGWFRCETDHIKVDFDAKMIP